MQVTYEKLLISMQQIENQQWLQRMSLYMFYPYTILDHLLSHHILCSRHWHRNFHHSSTPNYHIRFTPNALLVVPQQKSRQLQNIIVAKRVER